jgi:DNA polymerase-1
MNLDFKLSLDGDKKKEEAKKKRIKEAEEKKKAKLYQPTDSEIWFTGYTTHTGTRKAGIFQTKLSKPDKEKMQIVYEAIKAGEISKGVEDMKKFNKTHAKRLYDKLMQIRRKEMLERMVQKTPDNYILVMNMTQLAEMVDVLINEPIIPVDTETTGLNLYGKDKIVGVSFTALNADLHYYIPISHDEGNIDDVPYALQVIGNLLSWETKEYIFHNAVFDLHQFANYGISCKGKIHDTQEIMKVLNENEASYRLKDLVPKYLGIEADTFNVLFGKTPFNEVALKYARYYACKDTHVTGLLYLFQLEHLKKQESLYKYYVEVEQPLIRVVFEMEREGFLPVLDEADKVSIELGAEVDQLREELLSKLGDINLDSPKQLLPALNKVGIEVESTGKDELKKFKENPIIKLLLDYREKHKLNKDFISRIRDFVQPDGKVHGSFNPNGARTGRFSSKEPNLQQIPPYARRIYRVDDNSLILGLDFSAQEPRMLASYTQEPILIENYRKGRDLYATLASEFYNRPYEECYKNPDGSDTKARKEFKVVVLAIMYQMGAKSLGSSLGISRKQAQKMIDTFYEKFTKVAEFVRSNTAEACRQGYVEMKLGDLSRKRRFPFFRGRNPQKVYDTYSTNAKIQGTSAIQTKKCMIEGDKQCKELSKPNRTFALLACVHDELLFRVPKDVTREEVALFEKIMTETVKLNNIASATDGELGNVWGDLTPIKRFFEVA